MRSQQINLAHYCCWLGPALVVAIGVALVGVWQLPNWVSMWALAFAVFAGFKWLTYCEARVGGLAAPKLTRFLYLFCWPGMSLKEFARTTAATRQVNSIPDWIGATAKTLIGAGFVWLAVPAVPADAWLLRGWVGMVGIIMMLHFGTFHLLALALQAGGFNARPNMQAPLLASSLADFWGKRWNTAFNVLADRYGFRLLAPRIGSRAALGVVFLASGLLHEAVITVPARGGYGLPTAYFGLQAAGIFVERLLLVRKRPWLKRLIAWVVLVVPLGWLFPPVFVRNVMLPMLHAIGATGNLP
jgi:alginate O-acetyltransferase complex protein AlgI